MKMQIVGFDPSLSNWGVALATLDLDTLEINVSGLHVIQTEPEKDKKMRKVVRKNSEDLERAKLLYKGAADAAEGRWLAFVEIPVGSQSSRAMASYGCCIGVLAAVGQVIPVIQVTPNEVKLAGCGIKTASKEEMIQAMIAKHPAAPWPVKTVKGFNTPIASKCEHLADAIASIEAGIKTDEFKRAVAMMRGMSGFREKFAA